MDEEKYIFSRLDYAAFAWSKFIKPNFHILDNIIRDNIFDLGSREWTKQTRDKIRSFMQIEFNMNDPDLYFQSSKHLKILKDFETYLNATTLDADVKMKQEIAKSIVAAFAIDPSQDKTSLDNIATGFAAATSHNKPIINIEISDKNEYMFTKFDFATFVWSQYIDLTTSLSRYTKDYILDLGSREWNEQTRSLVRKLMIFSFEVKDPDGYFQSDAHTELMEEFKKAASKTDNAFSSEKQKEMARYIAKEFDLEYLFPENNASIVDGIDDSGQRISYGKGKAIREPSDGKGRFDLITPFGLARLARWYELGAKKYADRNWEKGGIPFSRYLDSTLRHLNKFLMGMNDEDHLAAAAWNILCIIHHQELGQVELDDLPHYMEKKEEDKPDEP